eukprot:5021484-Heterocapsa_arctica.AAC.1
MVFARSSGVFAITIRFLAERIFLSQNLTSRQMLSFKDMIQYCCFELAEETRQITTTTTTTTATATTTTVAAAAVAAA